MPWTPAHPALVLPFFKLFRRPFASTCLVIGSMAPDLPYFFLVRFESWSHTFPLSFFFGVPVTILVAYFWMYFLRPTLFEVLPIAHDVPEHQVTAIVKENLLVSCLVAAIGIATHLFIDGFTHAHGYSVDRWSVLRFEWGILGKTMPVWHFLQMLLTAVGLIVIASYFFMSPHWKWIRAWRMNARARMFWINGAIFSLMAGFAIFFLRGPFVSLAIMSVAVMTSLAVGVTVASLRMKYDF